MRQEHIDQINTAVAAVAAEALTATVLAVEVANSNRQTKTPE